MEALNSQSLGQPRLQRKHSGQASTGCPRQGLETRIEIERFVDGVEMGVLESGIPYLTQRGLAEIVGAARGSIQELAEEWRMSRVTNQWPDGRMRFFRNYLSKSGYDEPSLSVEIHQNGLTHFIYMDTVCMAMLEYHAFEAPRKNQTALLNFRKFARYGLKEFVYRALCYVPKGH
jgi:hypothetical protein